MQRQGKQSLLDIQMEHRDTNYLVLQMVCLSAAEMLCLQKKNSTNSQIKSMLMLLHFTLTIGNFKVLVRRMSLNLNLNH